MKGSAKVRRCAFLILLLFILAPMGRGQVDPAEIPIFSLYDEIDLACLTNTLNDNGFKDEVAEALEAAPIQALLWRRFYVATG